MPKISRMLVGLVLFLSSFGVIYSSEGDFSQSEIADGAIQISAEETADVEAEGQLVSVFGTIHTDETLGDEYILPGNYLAIVSDVEVYGDDAAWVSDSSNSSKRASSASIGIYDLNLQQLDLAGYEPLSLNEQIVSDPSLISGKYIDLGDTRISYKVIPNDIEATVIGMLDGGKIEPTEMFLGSEEDALSQLDTEFDSGLWGLRLLGMILMWLGLGILLAPLSTMINSVPMLGSIGNKLLGIVSFVLSLIFTLITISISKIFHNMWILIGGVAVIMLFFYFMKNRRGGPINKIKL